MSAIRRHGINEKWAYSELVEAGDFVYVNFCVRNIESSVECQVNGAFDELEERLQSIGLGLDSVVKLDCLFRDVWNIPLMEKAIKERFHGNYPARKSIQTEFALRGGEKGLHFQLDAIAYKNK